MSTKCFLVAFTAIFTVGAFSQMKTIHRDDLNVTVHIQVTTSEGPIFRYQYTFQNERTSHQSMVRVVLELGDEWAENGGTLQNVVPPKEKDWGQFPTVGRTMRWNANYETTGIDVLEKAPLSAVLPGEQLHFEFENHGLPSVGSYWVAGWAPWYFTARVKDSLLKAGYAENGLIDIDENALRGTTLVPRIIRQVPAKSSFLDTLISYKHQALSLGWIDNTGIANSLDQKLDAAKKKLVGDDNSAARNILQAFVNEVEAQKDKHLTSEAYALLKFNAEFLIDRLATGGKEGKK